MEAHAVVVPALRLLVLLKGAEAGGDHCWPPCAPEPVRVAQRAALAGREEERIGVSSRDADGLSVGGEELGEGLGHGESAPAGVGLRLADGRLALRSAHDSPLDAEGAAEEVEGAHLQASDLAPAEPQDGAEPHHGPMLRRENLSDRDELLRGEHVDTRRRCRRELDAS